MAFVTERRVEFGETDLAGIVHFSNFFRYMEAAETAYLRERGLSVHWQSDGEHFGFPRVSAACDYLSPARFEDVLRITVEVEKVGTKSVTYRHDFFVGDRAVAVGRVTAVYTRAAAGGGMESLAISDELRAKLLS